MYTIELNVDDSILNQFKDLLEILPKDKVEVISYKKRLDKNDSSNTSRINELLKEQNLLHFEFFEGESRIIYTYESGTSSHMQDFKKLIGVLKDNNIKHHDIGLDVIIIEED